MQLLESTFQLVVVEDGWTHTRAGDPTRAGRVRGSRSTTRGQRRGYGDTIVKSGRQGTRGDGAAEAALQIHDSQREGRHVGAAGGEPGGEPRGEPEENHVENPE